MTEKNQDTFEQDENQDFEEKHEREKTTPDKQKILNDLQKTAKDMPLFVRSLFKPIISYVERKYDNLPDEKKHHIQRMVNDIKTESNKWISAVKTTVLNFFSKIKKTENKQNIDDKDTSTKEKNNENDSYWQDEEKTKTDENNSNKA